MAREALSPLRARRSKAVLAWLFGAVVAFILLLPLLVHRAGLLLIPEERFTPPAEAPANALRAYWASLGGTGDPRLAAPSPYTFALVMLRGNASAIIDYGPEATFASEAARALIPPELAQSKGKLGWHLAGASASIWAARHWTPAQAAGGILREAHFGHGFVGLDAASRGYFDKEREDLTLTEYAALVVATHSSRNSPWCHPERHRDRLALLLAKLDHEPSVPDTTPPPEGACHP